MSWADYEHSNGRQRLVNEADPTPDLSLQKNQTFPTERTLAHNGSANATVIDLIEIIVNESPESEALRFGAHSLTFKELDILSTRLARYLRSKGIKEEIMVPVCMDRSLEMIIGILGVLKAGGAFVPIDPQLPQSRIRKILQETDAAVVLTHQQTNGKITGIKNSVEIIEWEKIESVLNSPAELPSTSNRVPEHLAYVIFTSGSTGTPKGVLVEHRQLLSATQARISYYGGFSNVLLVPALAFDASLAAIFGSLCSGGCLFICSREDLQNPHQLEQLIPQLDTLLCVPSYYRFLLEEDLLKNANLSKVILGGEVISPELVRRHFEANSGALLYNEYGPTETTIWATVEQINPTDQHITVGRPIEGVEAYILDPDGKLLEENIIGELYLGGKGVTRGYLNDPHKTAESFIDNPFSSSKSRLYKTGDLCYQLPDGRLMFVGRTDDQVKINGYRMEVGEIESALQHLEGVRQAAVIVKKREHGTPYLAAFVQCTKKLDQQSLRDNLRTQLPDYMIPNIWVQLDNFPLTANGKIDRQALQALGNNQTQIVSVKRPDDSIENPLINLWQYHLPVQNITVEDDFFDLGGNSIMAMALVASMRRKFNIDISVSDLFQHRTIARITQHLKLDLLQEVAQADTIPLFDPRPEEVPLSSGQEALWLIDKFGEGPSYHLSIALQIEGDLNVEALTSSLRDLLQRHEVLRTVINESQEDHLQQLLPLDDWKLVEILSPMAQDDLNELIRSPFDLSKDFMLRAWLIKKAPKENILFLVIHHIAFDAWSKRIFLDELWSSYSAYLNKTSPSLPPLPLQYADYALWQRSVFRNRAYGQKMAYWKTKLHDLSPLQLPGDFISGSGGIEGAVKTFSIPPVILDGLKILSKKQGSTLFMTLLAGFKALLYKYSSQEDICIGTAIAGREVPGTESLIGYFINTLALRTEVKGEVSFLELLDKVKHTTIEAYEAKDIPFEKVVAEIGVERRLSQNPLFQVMFNFHNIPQARLDGNVGLKLSLLDTPQTTSKFDLTFSLTETEEGLDGVVEFRTGRYLPSTIERMIQHYVLLLESAVYNPSEKVGKLNILSDVERKQLLSEFNQTVKKYPPNITVLDLLEEQARNTPDKVAVIFGDQEITYKTLDEKSNQLAHHLQENGASEETLILLCMQRSLEMVIAILGILKSGAAYVPIDPAYPQERKKFIQEDTAATVAVTDVDNHKELSLIGGADLLTLEVNIGTLSQYPAQKVTTSVQPGHLAYVIYTSGSTGKPKGVMIEHQNLYSFISWCKEEFSASPYDVVYAATSICFDLSVFEIFYPLSTGAPIRLLQDALEIKTYLSMDQQVLINTVPSVVGHLLEEGTDLSNVSVLNMAGEPITKKILEGLDVDKIEVRNLYGPTEDTTYSTIYRIGSEREILVGKPISNTSVYIVNQEYGLNPVGVPGELCLAGSGLARGYFRRPDLTEEKFVPNPFVQTSGSRMYKTGDIARWLPNGQIEYVGRRDDQVKIRGYRIELGEIERVLQQHEQVRNAVVLAKADHKGNQQLVGYLAVDGLLDKKSIMAYLKQRLPLYMVPSLWVQLEAFPLTPNGKIDKKKLPDPNQDGHVNNEFVAPRNETEKKLAQIWENLLGTEGVGIYDDFFALGGHSLMAARFIAAVRKEYKADLRIQDLFSFPTIAGLAENYDFRSNSSSLPALQSHLPRPERIPLSYNQESLWFLDQLSGSNHYHIPLLLRLEGVLDQHALELALKNILKRHEVLRTSIQNNNGVPHQVITDHTGDLITLIDASDLCDYPEKIQQIIARLIDQPFDLSADHMIRTSLIYLNHDSHLLVLVIHHIAFDGWSISLFLDELAISYKAFKEGRRPVLPPFTLQYSDYAIWQKQYLQGELLRTQLSYWKQKLHNTAPLHLPLDYRRPPVQRYEGSVALSRINNNLKERLEQIGQARSATLFMTLLTAFKVLLYRYSSQQDICVGTVTAGRHQKDTEQLIGYFTQTVPIRTKINPKSTFEELLQEVKLTSLEAFDNQQVPFEKIVAAVGVERDLSKNPLFQVMFVVQNYAEATTLELGDLTIAQQPVRQVTSKFDLSFIIVEKSSELYLSVEYNTSLFKQTTIDRLSADYISLLHQIILNPSAGIGRYPIENRSLLDIGGVPPAVNAPEAVEIGNGSELVDVNLQQPKTETFERITRKIWVEALGVKHIDVNDNFFEIGGQSLVAVQVMSLLEKELGIKLPLSILFKHPTIREMARVIAQKDREVKSWKSLVPIKTKGNKPPLYIIHGGGANILPFYDIAKNMDPDQPVYGLQPKGLDGKEKPLTSVEAIASHFMKEILDHNPEGTICLAGYSFGGIIAFEMAKQLKARGKEIKHLVMFDTIAYQSDYKENWQVKLRNRFQQNIAKRWVDLYLIVKYPKIFKRIKKDSLRQKIQRFFIWLGVTTEAPPTGMMKLIKDIEDSHREASKNYILKPYDGTVHLMKAKIPAYYNVKGKPVNWEVYASKVNVLIMDGEHTTMFSRPHDVKFAQTLQQILDA